MIGATLDANTLASGFVGFGRPESTPGQLLHRWLLGAFDLLLSDHIIEEVTRTLAKPYFASRLTAAQRDADIVLLRRRARLTPITTTVQGIATHPEDDLVLATAVSGGAAYLVTGDGPLRRVGTYRGVTLLSPRQFLNLLDQTETEQRGEGTP